MRLSELSRRSGLSTATVKYYLRLGLLSAGETESSTWASYDEEHLRRLHLVRALTDVAGLSLDDVRRVVEAVEDPDRGRHASLGAAQWAVSPAPQEPPSDRSLARVESLLARNGWQVRPESPHRPRLAAALDALDAVDHSVGDELLDSYADAVAPLAEHEVGQVPAELDRAVESVVVGTLLREPVLLTMHRMADEAASGRVDAEPE